MVVRLFLLTTILLVALAPGDGRPAAGSRSPSRQAARAALDPGRHPTKARSRGRRGTRDLQEAIRKTSTRRSGWAAGPRTRHGSPRRSKSTRAPSRVHPDEPRLYRHRGHRYITIRKPDLAIKDLQKAADLVEGTPDQVEPDGQPNDRNVPTSTLQTNIYYHLGLAHYLKAEFPLARDAYRKCLGSRRIPTCWSRPSAWLYMTLRRDGV